MFVLHNFSSHTLTFKLSELPELTRKEFAHDIETLEGSNIRIKSIQVKKKFYQIVRNYQVIPLLEGVLPAIAILLHGATFGLLYLIDAEYARSVSSYHAVITYGILIAGSSLILGFYLFSVVLENFRRISAALVAAVLSAGLPFLIDFVLGGQIDISGDQQAIFAGSGGLTVALVTTITSNIKESME